MCIRDRSGRPGSGDILAAGEASAALGRALNALLERARPLPLRRSSRPVRSSMTPPPCVLGCHRGKLSIVPTRRGAPTTPCAEPSEGLRRRKQAGAPLEHVRCRPGGFRSATSSTTPSSPVAFTLTSSPTRGGKRGVSLEASTAAPTSESSSELHDAHAVSYTHLTLPTILLV